MFINKLKKLLLNNKKFLENKKFKIFCISLYDPCIWYFNKYTISRAVSIGLFFAWIPVPLQMLLAASFAILFKANFPVSVTLVWLTNPITMPIFFLFAYKVGVMFFSVSVVSDIYFELSFAWLFNKMCDIWQPFMLGCIICAVTSSVVGNVLVRLLWRFLIVKHWYTRRRDRK